MSEPGFAGKILLDAGQLDEIVRRIGRSISEDHPDGVVLVGILKGSVCLVADLAREITVPCAVDFLALSAYGAGGTRIRLSKDLDADVAGRAVVIVVDIVDSGLTVSYVRRLLNERGARSTDVCALLDRVPRRLLPVDLRYVGIGIGDEYVVGYGIDYEERYRNLPFIVATDPESLKSHPAAPDLLRIAGVQGA
ncbi:MAG TPA: phosphoribosyltransferase family protein [Acidimicrobiales bacterium]|nr:phosphoribosyltransferase family protein [Acidimicrobiales bacterium]